MSKKIDLGTIILHIFVGIGAFFGGGGVLLDPSGQSMGVSTDMLVNGPFHDFLFPGLFLFFVLGTGNLLAAFLGIKKQKLTAYFSFALGGILALWILIQCYMLYAISFLHVLFFLIGMIQMILAILQAFDRQLFPATYFLNKKAE